MSTKLLENKTALVSGGSRGLGQAICLNFLEHGANVAFLYSTDEASAAKTISSAKSCAGKLLGIKCSVLDQEGLHNAAKQVENSIGGIDILINNAGISQPLPMALMEEADWDRVLDVNIKGQFLLAHAVLPGMIRRKSGTILNISSLAGLRLIEAPVHYSASKAAVKGFTEALCKEVARYNIRVNCLAPGLLDDGVGQSLPEHRLRDYVDNVALNRVGTVAEVAKLATFLSSDRNSYMNGATIVMDGGF